MFESFGCPPKNISETEKKTIARRKFESGPANETIALCFKGFLKFEGLTGTGFAQPIRNAPLKNDKKGRSSEPIGSICLIGLSVYLPCCSAVLSPNFFAEKA